MRQLAEGLSDETGRYVSAAGKHPAGYHRAHGRNPPVRGSSAKNGSPSGALWREFFFCGPPPGGGDPSRWSCVVRICSFGEYSAAWQGITVIIRSLLWGF